ncbi:type VI secretion system Vgr family protein [Photobacterium sp. 1_MG-2023]|uniref:type VI secretion system Vgr family protein n=1 Tax=Photobacterium sp. 1_MG-2023 TaxID=3062646 RepID=UPI0026E42DD6|nr:type VI secretion system tip protein TssI/VgrG [Photobacterium sp. 1_MG-2023]MDO6706074.1 type VI secretion system tip protein TssI/VgrG [Photobacterium sp. 1_MG-2023]
MSHQVQFSFSIEETDHDFRVESFEVEERLFQPFEVKVSLLSRDADIALDDLVRKAGVLKLLGQGRDVSRYFHGIVKEARFKGSGRQFNRYELVLVPDLWFLTQREDCRIFQDLTLNEIIESVLAEANVTAFRMLADAGEKQEYILQYRETDLEFIHRLMAQHGLWYFFDHSETGHELVIVDKNELISELVSTPENATLVPDTSEHAILYHGDAGGVPDREHIFEADFATRVHTGAVSQTDYHHLTPHTSLMASAADFEAENSYIDLAVYQYPGRYHQQPQGMQQADYRLSAHKVSGTELKAVGCVMRFIPGYSFVMESHPRQSLNRDFILLQVKHYGRDPQVHAEERSGEPTTYHNEFIAFPADLTYRAPAQKAPVVEGPQTAVVVGPETEEIYTDNLGRVKVQFHWDRLGGMDEHSTCWVRVSQTLAGPSWGAVFLPRIGHEVVVTFLEGDPDQPLVTGSVYHGLHRPPYDLPLKKTRTTIRSKTHKGEGYNEISLDDETNQEELYLRAQKDMNTLVLHDRFSHIGQDDELKVVQHREIAVQGDRKELIHGNKTSLNEQTLIEQVDQDVTVNHQANEVVNVAGNQHRQLEAHRRVQLGQSDTLEIGADLTTVILASRSTSVGGNDQLTVGGGFHIETQGDTSIRAEGEAAVVSADEIRVEVGAAGLVLKSSGAIEFYGTAITLNGVSDVALKGGKVDLNPGAAAGSNQGVSALSPIGLSISRLKPPVITSAVFQSMIEEGVLMMELCECGRGKTCQLHR